MKEKTGIFLAHSEIILIFATQFDVKPMTGENYISCNVLKINGLLPPPTGKSKAAETCFFCIPLYHFIVDSVSQLPDLADKEIAALTPKGSERRPLYLALYGKKTKGL